LFPTLLDARKVQHVSMSDTAAALCTIKRKYSPCRAGSEILPRSRFRPSTHDAMARAVRATRWRRIGFLLVKLPLAAEGAREQQPAGRQRRARTSSQKVWRAAARREHPRPAGQKYFTSKRMRPAQNSCRPLFHVASSKLSSRTAEAAWRAGEAFHVTPARRSLALEIDFRPRPVENLLTTTHAPARLHSRLRPVTCRQNHFQDSHKCSAEK